VHECSAVRARARELERLVLVGDELAAQCDSHQRRDGRDSSSDVDPLTRRASATGPAKTRSYRQKERARRSGRARSRSAGGLLADALGCALAAFVELDVGRVELVELFVAADHVLSEPLEQPAQQSVIGPRLVELDELASVDTCLGDGASPLSRARTRTSRRCGCVSACSFRRHWIASPTSRCSCCPPTCTRSRCRSSALSRRADHARTE
jgi:hypothetical protein